MRRSLTLAIYSGLHVDYQTWQGSHLCTLAESILVLRGSSLYFLWGSLSNLWTDKVSSSPVWLPQHWINTIANSFYSSYIPVLVPLAKVKNLLDGNVVSNLIQQFLKDAKVNYASDASALARVSVTKSSGTLRELTHLNINMRAHQHFCEKWIWAQ